MCSSSPVSAPLSSFARARRFGRRSSATGWIVWSSASLVWHELAHVNGADERAALDQERALWRGFIRLGLVSSSDGMAYIHRLREASITTKEDRDTRSCDDDESVC